MGVVECAIYRHGQTKLQSTGYLVKCLRTPGTGMVEAGFQEFIQSRSPTWAADSTFELSGMLPASQDTHDQKLRCAGEPELESRHSDRKIAFQAVNCLQQIPALGTPFNIWVKLAWCMIKFVRGSG